KNTVIPNTVEAIGDGAFSYNPFTTISIPNSVKSIGLSAFSGCTNLKSIMIPPSVQKLDNAVFYNCYNLLALSVPEGITVIPENFCYECAAMETMILPSTTKEVWAEAFNGNLKDLYCFAMTPPQEVYGSFLPWIPDGKGWYYYATTLHVPAAALQSYKDSEVWGIFQEILPMTDEETGVKEVTVNEQQPIVNSEGWYTLQGVKLDEQPTQKGIYLYNGKKVAVQ
ncbi:MAG: leucine-rich repeat domain-containing protein, partial [Bacteroidaceae bacterium]|nr:leucine-rich repeat domain-containing protein [Bacteroidaceae bacterium]